MLSTRPASPTHRDPVDLTRPERDAAIVARRAEGHTLASIAEEFGMTRERVRQIVAENGGPTRIGVKRIRDARERAAREALRERCLDHLAEFPALTLTDLAEALAEEPAAVRCALGDDARRLLAGAPREVARVSDEELLGELRLAAGLIKGPLTGGAYDRVSRALGLHSRMHQIHRFDTWAAACKRAGVTAGKPRRGGYKRQWTPAEMLQWVARYLGEPDSSGSYAGYEKFARRMSGAPSAETVRVTIGPWSTIKAQALSLGVKAALSAAMGPDERNDIHHDPWVA